MIGVVADDFTGGTDVAVFLRRAGLRTEIRFGPESLTAPQPSSGGGVDAVVVALKTRTLPAEQAVTQSLRAAAWLRDHGADQLFFKYCSTFDSTAAGNIGPVADALLDLTGSSTTVVVPASPAHGRTQYAATLFVHGVPLAESPMRHHPLTPMTDSNVVRLLQAQTARPVAAVSWATVRRGPAAIRAAVAAAQLDGVAYLVIDALDDADMDAIGQACQDLPLLTGAAGLAGGLGSAAAAGTPTSEVPVAPTGERAAALAGSCSARTLEQIDVMQRHHASYHLDALRTPDARALATEALRWFDAQPADAPAPLIYSSQPSEQLRRVQDQLGTERASALLEEAAGLVARGLVERGVRRLVVAGGETSGAVVTALGAPSGLIGVEEAPGVPWIRVDGEQPLWLLLKSGNFGDADLLVRACEGEQVPA